LLNPCSIIMLDEKSKREGGYETTFDVGFVHDGCDDTDSLHFGQCECDFTQRGYPLRVRSEKVAPHSSLFSVLRKKL